MQNYKTLLVGIRDLTPFQNLNNFSFTSCNTAQEALEVFIEKDFHLLICNFQLPDENAITFNQSIQAFLQYYPKSSKKDTKILVITHGQEEEKQCKENNLCYFPSHMDLSPVISKLITLPFKTTDETSIPPINFEELFHRVDNNRQFVKTVIDQFFESSDERIEELRNLTQKQSFQDAKNSAHKLKGVLANFSMKIAQNTIKKVEDSIVKHELKNSLDKINKLEHQIQEAKDYYDRNQILFE